MTAKKQHLLNSTHVSRATSWTQYLAAETRRLDETGVAAAIVSIRLTTTDERVQRQVVALLGHVLNPTDTFDLGPKKEIFVLLAPVQGIVALADRVRELHGKLAKLGAGPVTGYAARRDDEDLVATLARADANVDRTTFRQQRYPSVLVLPESD